MPSTSMLRAAGLNTFNNYLSSIPEGSQLKAENVIIDKNGVIEPRRGITQYAELGLSSADKAKQLLLYKDRILVHYQSTIEWDNGSGTFTPFPSTFVETSLGLRIKYIEANGNLYLTTSEGVKKVAAVSDVTLGSATVGLAGPIKAITGTGECDYSQPVFPGYSKVAYRITWATKDVNGNLIEGAPSPAIEITNQSPDACAFRLRFQVPNGITTDYFYRIYRTQIVTAPDFAGIANLETGDEMRLVIEDAYITGTEIVVVDTTPDSFRDQNLNLYTNEFSGEGILQANEAPPFATDIAQYKNYVFYANTRLKHKLLLNLLGVGGFQSYGGVQDSIDIVSITYLAPNTTITFSANHGLVAGQEIVILGSGDADLDGVQTIDSVTPTEIVVVADGDTATVTDISIYGSSVSINQGVTTNTYFFIGRPEITDITHPDKATIVDGGYYIGYSYENLSKYMIWFDKTGTTPEPAGGDTVGAIKIRVDISDVSVVTATDVGDAVVAAVDASSFDFIVNNTAGVVRFVAANSGTSNDWADGLVPAGVSFTKIQDGQGEDVAAGYIRLSSFVSAAQSIDDTARSMVKVITGNPSSIVNAYYIFKPNDVPGQMLLEAKTLDTAGFTIVASSAQVGALFNPNIATPATSDNEISPNRLYYSKESQPEAVPIVNYYAIGPRDKLILRIVALRDSLFIFKEEGIYRLSGDNPTNFFITLFDSSAILLAPDTAAILNNQIYCLSTQGIITVSETGVSVISRPVENLITKITAPAFVNYKTASFGASYESDRAYFVWIPELPTDTAAQECLRFNTFTNTWTSWAVGATCAVVNPDINKLYIGAQDTNLVEVERKVLNRDDYADRQYPSSINDEAFFPTYIEVPSTALMKVGDAIRQTQYLTMSQVIRFAKKLFYDSSMPNTISNNNKLYYKNYDLINGCDLSAELGALMAQLNSDMGTAYQTSFSNNFVTLQNQFNAIINNINTNPLFSQSNYGTSSGSIDYELLIAKVIDNNKIEVLAFAPFIVGPTTHYKSIQSDVIWAPIFFGEPSMMKHIRDGKIQFDVATLAFAKLSFNTDLSTNYEGVNFLMEGDGSWGTFFYSSTTWGGEGTNRPFRTLIPRQKQRCNFIRTRFEHSTAFYRYGILGIQFAYEMNSERSYK